jgi:ribonuclease BN (tRNA processing enzyme)
MPSIMILGANGGRAKNMHLTSLQISQNSVIDAGNLIDALEDNVKDIDHIFLTHSHLDHIIDIPFLIDDTFTLRKTPLKIYGQKSTLNSLKKHILNGEIWPDFSQIPLIGSDHKAIEFIPIYLNTPYKFEEYCITAIDNNHTESSNGYLIEKENSAILFSSDTYCSNTIWDTINHNKKITTLIIDISFPSRYEQLAFDSKHLTPKLLKKELEKLHRSDITIHVNHLKPSFKNELIDEIYSYDILLNNGTIIQSQDIIEF